MAIKDVHGMLNEIKDYDSLRKVLKVIFLYGAHSDSDLISKNLFGIKERAYKDLIKRLDNYLNAKEYSNKDHFSYQIIPGRKTDKRGRRIIKDPFDGNFEFLASTFHQHTVSLSDIQFFLFFLFSFEFDEDESLNGADYLGEAITENDVTGFEDMCERLVKLNAFLPFNEYDLYSTMADFYTVLSWINNPSTKDTDSESFFPLSKEKVHARLNELATLGYIHKMDSTTYKLAPDFFAIFDEFINAEDNHSNLTDLKSLITFFYNFSCLCVPGFFLSEKISEYLLCTYIDVASTSSDYRIKETSDSFFYENTRFQNIIDDDITWNLIEAINTNSVVSYEYQTSTFDKRASFTIYPIMVIDDIIYGRHYIWGYLYNKNSKKKITEVVLHRIDRIFSLKTDNNLQEDVLDTKSLRNNFSEWISEAYNVSGGLIEKKRIVLEFSFDNSEYANYMKKRLLSCPYGKNAESTGNNKYLLSIEIKNPDEMIPFINSFGAFVRVSPESDLRFYETYKTYVKDNLSLYESV